MTCAFSNFLGISPPPKVSAGSFTPVPRIAAAPDFPFDPDLLLYGEIQIDPAKLQDVRPLVFHPAMLDRVLMKRVSV